MLEIKEPDIEVRTKSAAICGAVSAILTNRGLRTVAIVCCLLVLLPLETARRLQQNAKMAARKSCQAMLADNSHARKGDFQGGRAGGQGSASCARWKYTPIEAGECLRMLSEASTSPETRILYFEGDSRVLYMMQHMALKYLNKTLPREDIRIDLGKRLKGPHWELKVKGHNFTSINLEMIWRRARMMEHTSINPNVSTALQNFFGERVPLLAVYNLALDVNYPNRTQSEFGLETQAKFREFANKSMRPWVDKTQVVWVDGPPVLDAIFNTRILNLNRKMRAIVAEEYPGVMTWPTLWHHLESLLTQLGKKRVFTPDQIHLRDAANDVCAQTLFNVLCNNFQASRTNEYLCCSEMSIPAESVFIFWWSLAAVGAIFVSQKCRKIDTK